MDSLTALKTAIQSGSSPYDEAQSVNAMLNRKLQRQTPLQVLEYLDKIVCAIVEGANQNLIAATAASSSSSSSASENLPKIVFDTFQTVFKTWQNGALPTFISGACINGDNQQQNEQARLLPETLERVLGVLAEILADERNSNNNNSTSSSNDAVVVFKAPQKPATLATSVASHYARYLFASKLVSESATRSLSDQNLRRARFFAQVSAIDSYLFIAAGCIKLKKSTPPPTVISVVNSLFSVVPENFADLEFSAAKSMALSATMWLGDILGKSSTASSALDFVSSTSTSSTTTSTSFNADKLFMKSCQVCLNLLAKSFVSASTPIDEQLFNELPPALQARCLVQLAWRGLSRAAPVSVLFRRLHALGLSSAKPCFLFLNCVGLLSDAPASLKRDKAIGELVDVYFTRKPAAPLATQTDLKKDFDAFSAECLIFKGNENSNSGGGSSKAEMD